MTLFPKLGVAEIITPWHFRYRLLLKKVYKPMNVESVDVLVQNKVSDWGLVKSNVALQQIRYRSIQDGSSDVNVHMLHGDQNQIS